MINLLLIFFSLLSEQEKRPQKTINLRDLSYLYCNQTLKDMTNIENEIWKDLIGFEGLYKISNMGRFISLPKKKGRGNGYITQERNCTLQFDKDGYLKISLCKDSFAKKYLAHRLVAIHFIPNPENKLQVNHLKGIKTDIRASELEWSTQS